MLNSRTKLPTIAENLNEGEGGGGGGGGVDNKEALLFVLVLTFDWSQMETLNITLMLHDLKK